MHLSSLPHLCQQCLPGLKCSEAVSHRCALRVLIKSLKPCWQEAAGMAASSTQHVPSEQHHAELLAAERFRVSMTLIEQAAQNMEDSFAIGGCEALAQPVLLVHNCQDARKMVMTAESRLRSCCLQ